MRISMKGDYGLRAMLDLAAYYGQGPIQSKDIAKRQYIGEPYLDQILMTLRKAGLVKSTRGPQGGHELARHPRQITMAEVVYALEGQYEQPGNLHPIDCLTPENTKQLSCPLIPTCALREVWKQIDEYTHRLLNSITVEELASRHMKQPADVMYYI